MKNSMCCLLLIISGACAEKHNYSFKITENNGVVKEGPTTVDVSKVDLDNFKLVNNSAAVSHEYHKQTNEIVFVHTSEMSPKYTLVSDNTQRDGARNKVSATKTDGNIQLSLGATPVVQYRYQMNYPPAGVDSIFKKSGYIHPILTPKGDTLTRINAPDHWHHYGLWGPWTHTRIDTTRVDFWNLGQGMGTVLFKEFEETTAHTISASFTAKQEHLAFKIQETPLVGLDENVHVKLWSLNREDRYMFDYTTSFTSPLEDGILFEAYRYGGGLGLRFHERWKADNCTVLTSEGKDRSTADGSNARWCIVTGASSDGTGTNGILFMSHPTNRMHPEPMRIWPLDANDGRGDMFFEFCPIRHNEWKIAPNTSYELQYRMVVFDGELTAQEAEAYWQGFASAPRVAWGNQETN